MILLDSQIHQNRRDTGRTMELPSKLKPPDPHQQSASQERDILFSYEWFIHKSVSLYLSRLPYAAPKSQAAATAKSPTSRLPENTVISNKNTTIPCITSIPRRRSIISPTFIICEMVPLLKNLITNVRILAFKYADKVSD